MRCRLLAAVLALAAAAHAHGSETTDLMIYVTGANTPQPAIDHAARNWVTWMYRRIGITLTWRDGKPAELRSDGAVIVEVRFTGEGASVDADALGYAMPFANGVRHIYVLYDRVRRVAANPAREQPILAHVLAHEIGHVLEGTTWHAPAGLMKAHWTGADYDLMARRPLEFTRDDLDLMRDHIAVLRAKNRAP